MKKTKRLDPWMAVTLAILGCYLLFLIYPMFNLLRQSVFNGETGAFTLEYFQKFFGKSYYFSTLWNSFKVICGGHRHHAGHRRTPGLCV